MDLSQLTIRPMSVADLPAIQEIEEMEYAGEDSFIAEELHEMLFDVSDESLFSYEGYVAEYMGRVIGHLVTLKISKLPFIKNIVRIFVVEDHRRHGVGTQLMSLIEPTKMGDRVMAEVADEDYTLAKFMTQVGYTVTSVVPAEYDEDGERDMEGYFVFSNEKREPMALSTRNLWRAQ